MHTDLSPFLPKPRDWFTPEIEHHGWGTAEFVDPAGVVEGPVYIRADGRGSPRIEMSVSEFSPRENLPLGLLQFLALRVTETEGAQTTLRFRPDGFNQCTRLTVETADGTFDSTQCSLAHVQGRLFCPSDHPVVLTFHATRAHFDAKEGGQPRYWVLPLQNFLSHFVQHDPKLDQHPLRIFPTPEVPENLPEPLAMRARAIANAKNRMIVFEFGDEPAFIEALHDYDQRRERLLSRQEPTTITAVMVGAVGNNSTDSDSIQEWLPLDLLPILGLVSGSEVSAPWAEIRDAQGTLVRRVHIHLGAPVFSQGKGAIDEALHRATGALLTLAQRSPWYGTSRLQVTLKHIVRGSSYTLTVEDRLSHFFRALDGLSQELVTTKPESLTDRLSAQHKARVRKALRGAGEQIEAFAKEAERSGAVEEARTLRHIAHRVRSAPNVDVGFGTKLEELLQHFGLPDATIMEQHYKQSKRTDGRTWLSALSTHRGMIMHQGFIDFRTSEADPEEVWVIANHLQDILIRIVLKMIGYDGTYQPAVSVDQVAAPLDWLTPDLPATQLGYR